METETYKVAKDLLDEFASDQEKRALNVNIMRGLYTIFITKNSHQNDQIKIKSKLKFLFATINCTICTYVCS